MSITIDSIVSRNDALLDSVIDDETVILSIANSMYYGMNTIGSRIWLLLLKPIKVDRIISKIIDEYAVGRAECENDIISLLLHLEAEGLVKHSESQSILL